MGKLIVGKSLENRLDAYIREFAPTGNISYVVMQFDDGEEPILIAAKGEHTVHTGASMIKVLSLWNTFFIWLAPSN